MKKFNVLFLISWISFYAFAQTTVHLQWKPIQYWKNGISYLELEDKKQTKIADATLVPQEILTLPLSQSYESIRFQLSTIYWQDFNSKEEAFAVSKNWKNYLPSTFSTNLEGEVIYERGNAIGKLEFIPVRYFNGKYQKILHYNYKLQSTGLVLQNKAGADYPSHSVLATGKWYRIGIPTTGIYKLDKKFLTNIGISSTVDPRRIRIYGSGGNRLPEKNADRLTNDLQENAIFVEGENDGVLDATDFVLFYGVGTTQWKYNIGTNLWEQALNGYADSAYYFISTDIGIGKRMDIKTQAAGIATQVTDQFSERDYREKDLFNLVHTGSKWLGEDLATTQSYGFNIPNVVPNSSIQVTTSVAAQLVGASTSINLTANANNLGTLSIAPVSGSYNDALARSKTSTYNFTASGDNFTITVSKQTPAAKAWLDYITINCQRKLQTSDGNYLLFRQTNNLNPSSITKYAISTTATTNFQIWNITNPTNVVVQQHSVDNANQVSFTQKTDSIYEYAAVFTNGNFLTPLNKGTIANQDLHALPPCDLVIVTPPAFINEVNRLATVRREEGLKVHVLFPQQIYNEFSSGIVDPLAIRECMRMFYERKTSEVDAPKYLLLFGKGSYDNKNRIADNTNILPTYQSYESFDATHSYVSDDYYGLLETANNEGALESIAGFANELKGGVDIGVGRLLATNVEEARLLVDKLISYKNQPANLRNWRQEILLLADDEDNNGHLEDIETKVAKFLSPYKNYHLNKIYFDAYKQEVVSGGQRYPQVKDDINTRIKKGALVFAYVGHGGNSGFAEERVVTLDDLNTVENKNNLSCYFTATCDFTQYDDPSMTYREAGDAAMMNPKGAAIALMTTTRTAYIYANGLIMAKFCKALLKPKADGTMPYLGDLIRSTKFAAGVDERNFSLIGDPSMRLAYPMYKVVTTEFNNKPVSAVLDTLKALDRVIIKGFVADLDAIKNTDFNGTINITVYDKPANITTLANDPNSSPRVFKVEKNIIYKGTATVKNGDWTAEFIVPKDISSQFDTARISYYSTNEVIDASDYYRMIVGGVSANPVTDNSPPVIQLYMNSTKFVSGGLTDENPTLLAYLSDDNGINTTGAGIGHDISGILDGDAANPIILNDYYEANTNDYKSGIVTYPFYKLPVGKHTLELTAWDIMNKSSKASIDFIVAKSEKMALRNVLNYPNPFTTNTTFYIEHNQANEPLDIQIQIFSISGKIVKTITSANQITNSYRECIPWDGLDEYGDAIGKGTYIYRVKVRNNKGEMTDKYEKLVLLK